MFPSCTNSLGPTTGAGNTGAPAVLRVRMIRSAVIPKGKNVFDAGTKSHSFVLYAIIRLLEENCNMQYFQSFTLRIGILTKNSE